MGFLSIVLVFLFTWSLLFVGTYQLQSSQTQVLLQLKKHLEYPKELEIWQVHGVDFCSLSSTTQTNLTCQDNVVAELRIVGDKPAKVSSDDDDFDGFAIPNKTLSEGFSIDSFFTTLARLNTLRALSLVSLGIWGQIHDKIHRLYSLEYLDLSSNYLYGSVPAKISEMVKLQALIIDNNFLNGSVPSWFDSLVDLRVLSLKNNRLTGSFPSSFQSVKALTNITLSDNEISGKLPDLSPLKSLYMLDLSGNKFTSTLPPMPKEIVAILLSNNSFSGDIPRQYGQLLGLQRLDLSSNTLTGLPPASLFSLPVLSYLNLASNMLSGSISSHVKCGDKLEFVDISDNKLTGGLPSCLTAKSDTRIVKANGNCLSIDIQDQHEESQCKEAVLDGKKSGGKNKAILVGMIFGIVVLSVLLLLGLLVLCRSYCPRGLSEQHLWHKTVEDKSATGFASELSTNTNFISQAANLSKQGLTACRSFSLEELIDATNNFDNSALLGEGSQCGRLYKGRLQNGTQVAIRCLPLSKKFSIRNVKLRLDLLSKLQHQHLVCLLGHCLDSGGRGDYNLNKVFLVYEFMPNGTFRDHLSEKSPGKVLTWSERLTVLIGVAKAVHFLHTGVIPGFFNNRLRSNSILLDQHRMAKLSDYGLSIISERAEETCVGIGDSYQSWQISSLEDDAYSFGFIILEALVGPSLASTREAFLLKEMATLQNQDARARVMEPAVVAATSSQESVSIAVSIMQKCISPDASRPSFEDVLWNLQYAAQVQATADRERKSETASYI